MLNKLVKLKGGSGGVTFTEVEGKSGCVRGVGLSPHGESEPFLFSLAHL